ncbi:MAG: VanZ family protein [Flavobacterium sp.]
MITKLLLVLKNKAIGLALLWTLLILYLSLKNPSGEQRFSFANADKIVHFTFYFMFVILWYRYLFLAQKLQKGNKILLVFIAVLLGILVEVAQKYFTTTRQADVWDVVANSLGAFVGILVSNQIYKLKKIAI